MPIEKGTVCICVVGTKNFIWFKAQHTTVYSYEDCQKQSKTNKNQWCSLQLHFSCAFVLSTRMNTVIPWAYFSTFRAW